MGRPRNSRPEGRGLYPRTATDQGQGALGGQQIHQGIEVLVGVAQAGHPLHGIYAHGRQLGPQG